jgi:hypothetical protein
MHERTTRNIRKPGDVGNLNFSTFTQIRNGLISWSFEIPASAYCHRYTKCWGHAKRQNRAQKERHKSMKKKGNQK